MSGKENLFDVLMAEIRRVREEVMPLYVEIGRAGAIAVALMKLSLEKADTAVAEQDVVKMLVAYGDLKEISE